MDKKCFHKLTVINKSFCGGVKRIAQSAERIAQRAERRENSKIDAMRYALCALRLPLVAGGVF
jgi:hypothetical protein